VNSVKDAPLFTQIKQFVIIGLVFFSIPVLLIGFSGCGDKVRLPSTEHLMEFDNAGPTGPSVDVDYLVKAKIGVGSYRVVPGEVLEITMPAILQAVTNDQLKEGQTTAPYVCRLSESGVITLPVVGELEVTGKTLAQIESLITDAYYPKYTKTRPSVFARVTEYKTADVSISGAVKKPGIYSLRSDRMSLVALIMEAEGIIDQGAAVIRIARNSQIIPENQKSTNEKTETITIPTLFTGTTKFSKPDSTNRYSKQSQVQMAFQQSDKSSTFGRLTFTSNGKVLLAERLDITSKIERLALFDRLNQVEPQTSTAEMERNLCTLAGLLRPDYNKLNDASSISRQAISKTTETKPAETSNFDNNTEISKKITSGNLQSSSVIVLPVKGLYLPFADVMLYEGDSVTVEKFEMPVFTVIGLVNKPGNYQYPTDIEYSLMQAIGFAGGLDPATDPRYATIYRLKPDGTLIDAAFQIAKVKKPAKLKEAMNVRVKPGDIIVVEHTPRTRTKLFLDSLFRINIGLYYNLQDAWNKTNN
jgi:protein involved in polysaccharide export with SLBB domain